MTPFTANISQHILDDLKSRVIAARWPDELPSTNWEFGPPLEYMKKLVQYWAHQFDWRQTEHIINGFPNYTYDVDGYTIHFLHIRGRALHMVEILAPVYVLRWLCNFPKHLLVFILIIFPVPIVHISKPARN